MENLLQREKIKTESLAPIWRAFLASRMAFFLLCFWKVKSYRNRRDAYIYTRVYICVYVCVCIYMKALMHQHSLFLTLHFLKADTVLLSQRLEPPIQFK